MADRIQSAPQIEVEEAPMLCSSSGSDSRGTGPVSGEVSGLGTATVLVTDSRLMATRRLGYLDQNYSFLTNLLSLPCQGDTSGDFLKALLALCGGED